MQPARPSVPDAVVVCGPSGSGKTTLVSRLVETAPDLFRMPVSVTTRPARPGEVPGRDYTFVGRDEFVRMMSAGQLAEWSEYAGELYGTPASELAAPDGRKTIPVLVLDLPGAGRLAAALPGVVTVFIGADLGLLRDRLVARGDDPVSIERRLARAAEEIAVGPTMCDLVLHAASPTLLDDLMGLVQASAPRTA